MAYLGTPEAAQNFLRGKLGEDDVQDPDLVFKKSNTFWSTVRRRRIARFEFSILSRAADICVFFDDKGSEVGWRDNGRAGLAVETAPVLGTLRETVLAEMAWPTGSLVTNARASELSGCGWTIEAIIVNRDSDERVRIWVEPHTNKIIQLLRAEPTHLSTGDVVEAARARVGGLLAARKAFGQLPGPLEWYAKCPQGIEERSGTNRHVRVATFRHWSNAYVEASIDCRDVVEWSIERRSLPPIRKAKVPDDAAAIAEKMTAPEGAHFERAYAADYAIGCQAIIFEWSHWHDDMYVEGDFMSVVVHPDTYRRIEMRGKWHRPCITQLTPRLSRENALEVLAANRELLRISQASEVSNVHLVVLDTTVDDSSGPRYTDIIAWCIRVSSPIGFVELFVDAVTGTIANVRRTG